MLFLVPLLCYLILIKNRILKNKRCQFAAVYIIITIAKPWHSPRTFLHVCTVLGNTCHAESAGFWNPWEVCSVSHILLNSFVSQNFFTALLRYISHTVKFTHSKSKFSGFYYDRHILTSIDRNIKINWHPLFSATSLPSPPLFFPGCCM